MKYAFPAVFEQDGNGFSVYFPDDEGTLTCADTLEEAIFMARDALNLTLWDYEERGVKIPTPSKMEDIKLEPNQTIRMIYADTETYAKQVSEMQAREQAIPYVSDKPANEEDKSISGIMICGKK